MRGDADATFIVVRWGGLIPGEIASLLFAGRFRGERRGRADSSGWKVALLVEPKALARDAGLIGNNGHVDDEAKDRVTSIIARTFGNVMNPVVTALMTAAAITTGNPDIGGFAIPAGAFAGVLAEEAVIKARREWTEEGVGLFAEEVQSSTNKRVEEILEGLSGDRASRALLGDAVTAAAESSDEWTIRLLARAFVAGAGDGSRVNEMRLLISFLRGVDAADVRALAAIHARTRAAAEEAAADNVAEKDRLNNLTAYEIIAHFDPPLARIAALLVDRLGKIGLVDTTKRRNLTRVGQNIAVLLDELGASDIGNKVR